MRGIAFLNIVFAALLIAVFVAISVNPYQLLLMFFLITFASLGILLSNRDIIKMSGLTAYTGFFVLAYFDPTNAIVYLFSGIILLFFADIFTAVNEINDVNSLSQSLIRMGTYYMSIFILFIAYYYIVETHGVKITVSSASIALTIALYVIFRKILKEHINPEK